MMNNLEKEISLKKRIILYIFNFLKKPSNKLLIKEVSKDLVKSLFDDLIRKLVIGVSIAVALSIIIIFLCIKYT